MNAVFLKLVNMSAAASWLIIAVVLLRPLLKKAPKWLPCLLWAAVALRLICPLSLSSELSVYNLSRFDVAKTGQIEYFSYGGGSEKPLIEFNADALAPEPEGDRAPEVRRNPDAYLPTFMWIWLLGFAVMLLYAACSYLELRRRVRRSTPLRGNIRLCADIDTPFILGLIRPLIYLPAGMDERQTVHVLAHEEAHLKRLDHIWKPLGFALLSVHWFNPLCWLAYVLLCRDIELACDERVVRDMEKKDMIAYSEALLSCSVPRSQIAACPLAFGEVGVKERIKTVLNYKKPAFWFIILAALACVVVAVCFLTNPKGEDESQLPPPSGRVYGVVEVPYQSLNISFSMVAQENTPSYAVTEDMRLLSKLEYSEDEWTNLGVLAEYELTEKSFDELFWSNGGEGWSSPDKLTASSIRKSTESAWRLVYDGDALYYLLQQENGELYLARGYYDGEGESDPDSDDSSIRWLFKLAVDTTQDLDELDGFGARLPDIGYQSVYTWVNHSQEGYDAMVERAENRELERRYGNIERLTPLVKLDTKAELDAFYAGMSDYFAFTHDYGEYTAFSKQAERYDGDFFEEHSLFIAYLVETMGSVRHELEEVRVEDGVLEIGICRLAPMAGDAVMEGWFLAVAVPKADIAGCTAYDAYICAERDPNAVSLPRGKLIRSYEFEGEDVGQNASVSLYDSGEFVFMLSPLSSYLAHGEYTLENDRLTLITSDGRYTFVFDVEGDTLVFDASASSGVAGYTGITDGSVFE